jgi:hypothetical protein
MVSIYLWPAIWVGTWVLETVYVLAMECGENPAERIPPWLARPGIHSLGAVL